LRIEALYQRRRAAGHILAVGADFSVGTMDAKAHVGRFQWAVAG
jgi:hypothetical protein